MPYLTTTDGARLFYEVHGHGPNDVLLLHGMGSSEIWAPMLDHVDRTAPRLVSLDFRGHGRSAGYAGDFSYPRFNADILAVADAVESARPVVAGFSGGCKNAGWLAKKHPERVSGLMLVGCCGFGEVPVAPEVVAIFMDALAETRDVPPGFGPWFTEKIGHHRPRAVGPMASTTRAVLEASVRLWIGTSIADEVAGLTLPALVIAGAREPIYHPDFQRQTTLATLPGAVMEVLDCSHYIPCEEPAAVAHRLKSFVAGLR